jgi:putative nucleotidyltransferase with HDIG domain
VNTATEVEPAVANTQDPKPLVLVVDDEAPIRQSLKRLLRRFPIEVVTTESPHEAIGILSEREVAVVVTDYMMPGMNGIELLTLIRQRWPKVVSIMITACSDVRLAAEAVNQRLIRAFITKPWDLSELREQIMDAIRANQAKNDAEADEILVRMSLARDLEKKSGAAAFSLARAMDARDAYTSKHSENVSSLAQMLGRALKLSKDVIEELRIGGLLHDVGKIGVSDSVLLKEGRLSDEEYAAIQRHPQIGASIIEPLQFTPGIAAIILQHHENHDGSGYPFRTAAEAIQQPARIVRVVDAYEAMASDRVYRKALPREAIRAEFEKFRGSRFEPLACDAFLELLDKGLVDKIMKGS